MTQMEIDQEITEIHQMVQLLQNVDVGLVVLNQQHQVLLWNSFMENHSGLHPQKALGSSLFELFPHAPSQWLEHKLASVFKLGMPAYATWEQQPHPFAFKSYRPLTGTSDRMYQNLTFLPLQDAHNQVNQVCLLIYDVTESATSKQQLALANQELARLSRIDRLTQLYNRGYWEQRFEAYFKQCQRSKTQTEASLLIFDLDHFKRVNDTYGHPTGDAAIRHAAQLTARMARETDLAGRYGGEEFVLLLPDTGRDGGMTLAERLRLKVAKMPVYYDGLELGLTISVGLCAFSPDLTSAHQWLQRADEALYQAKKSGRNRVCEWRASPETN